MKKTSMPKIFKGHGYIKCYSSSSPRPVKALAILSETTVKSSAVVWDDLKLYWESEKGYISLGDQQAYYLHIFKRLYLAQKED